MYCAVLRAMWYFCISSKFVFSAYAAVVDHLGLRISEIDHAFVTDLCRKGSGAVKDVLICGRSVIITFFSKVILIMIR